MVTALPGTKAITGLNTSLWGFDIQAPRGESQGQDLHQDFLGAEERRNEKLKLNTPGSCGHGNTAKPI